MAELNEEQLLLLDNLMYYDGVVVKGSSVEDIARNLIDIASDYNKKSLLLSGGFESSPENIIEIANTILADEQLCDLFVVDSVNTDGVRASCFVDADGDATVAVRGTGGNYEGWSDNVEGAYGTGTECQEIFREFIDEQGAYYDDITVTGHSKGGNLAQYATILEGEHIDRCVSFDGQGFSNDFVDKYGAQISANDDKIKSICSNKDYVNILLNEVAGETVYLDTVGGFDAHSSYELWKSNQGTLKNGEYSDVTEQSLGMKILDVVADKLVDAINWLPDYIERPLVDCLASIVGSFFAGISGQLKVEDIADTIINALKLDIAIKIPGLSSVINWMENEINNIIADIVDNEGKKDKTKKNVDSTYGEADFYISCDRVEQLVIEINQCKRTLSQLADNVDRINVSGATYWMVNMTINKIENKMRKNINNLNTLQNGLSDINRFYTDTENRICVGSR